jgi:hypothetical protein
MATLYINWKAHEQNKSYEITSTLPWASIKLDESRDEMGEHMRRKL